MNDNDKNRKLAELEAMHRQQDERSRQLEQEQEARLRDPRVQRGIEAVIIATADQQLAPVADEVAGAIIQLAGQLVELDLISEENPGTYRYRVSVGDPDDLITGIEADHPDYGSPLTPSTATPSSLPGCAKTGATNTRC